MELKNKLEQYNSMLWSDILQSGNIEKLAKEAYNLHRHLGNPDSVLIKNQNFCEFNIDRDLVEKDTLKLTRNGISRPQPPGAENMELDVFKFPQCSTVNKFVKKTLNLSHCLTVHNLQKPGKIYSRHIDYNRIAFSVFDKEIADKAQATHVKKYIWFLSDQEIGQFFAVGKDNITWKSGDIISWPWYIPHATANASLNTRAVIMICGI